MVRKKIPVVSDRDNYVKVYYSKGSSGDFKEISKIKHPSTSTTITIKDTAEEKLEYKIKYWQKNLTFENGNNSPYINRESNIITFYRLTAPSVEVPDLSTKIDKLNGTGSGSFSINRAVGSSIGVNSVSMGTNNTASGDSSIAFGLENEVTGVDGATAIGKQNIVSGQEAAAIGCYNTVTGQGGIALGYNHTVGQFGTAMGDGNTVGYASFAAGRWNIAQGQFAMAFGENNSVGEIGNSINHGYAIGYNNKVFKQYSLAEGYSNYIYNEKSHAEGSENYAGLKYTNSPYGHVEGQKNIVIGMGAHAEGNGVGVTAASVDGNIALGDGSHVEGKGTIAAGRSQHVFGEYNIIDTTSHVLYPSFSQTTGELVELTGSSNSTYVEIVGNGSDSSNRSNARTLDWQGNEWLAGTLTCSGISAGALSAEALSMGRVAGSFVGENSFAEGSYTVASG